MCYPHIWKDADSDFVKEPIGPFFPKKNHSTLVFVGGKIVVCLV